jgi:gamma-glutamyltranspeptidase/glutathione hydrolase/leukotriene-C4 hydrolase
MSLLSFSIKIRMSLGDPEFVNITGPAHAMLSDSYLADLRLNSEKNGILPLGSYGGLYNITTRPMPRIDHGTSHFSIIDRYLISTCAFFDIISILSLYRWGNAVALTSTINTYFGSKVVSSSTGIFNV